MKGKLSWPRLGLMWLAGIDLRLTILAVPPVLPLIHRGLALDEKTVAVLMVLPVLLFGLAAVPGSLLISRIGARSAAVTGLLLIAVAAALRGLGPSAPMLFAMTFVMGIGVAVLQPTMPALVSLWFPRRIALATAIYANGLLIGEVLSASLTLPLVLPLVGGSWPWSFVVWSVPVLATALLMLVAAPPTAMPALAARRWWPDWRDATPWQLGLIQGGGSALYFACNAFLPDYLHAVGRPELVNDCLTALNAGQLPASFIVMAVGGRLAGRRWPFLVAALLGLISIAALLLPEPVVMIVATALIGAVTAFVLILTLALPPLLTTPDEVHRLSAGMLTVSYTIAFVVPLIGGAVWDATGIAATAFLPGALGAVIVFAAALRLRGLEQRA